MDKILLQGKNKVSAYAAGGAFAVSLILGFAVKNPAGIVLMRAFLSALLFGTLIRVGLFILEKFIPEVLNREEIQADSTQQAEAESIEGDTAGQQTFTSISESEEVTLEDEELEEIGGDSSEELESPEKVAYETESGTPKTEEGGEPKSEEDEELEEIEEDDALGDLPAIDTLFEEDNEEINGEEETVPKSPEKTSTLTGDYIDVGNVQIPNEPETIAKAIRKVIKQE
jgi:hypothetical protein